MGKGPGTTTPKNAPVPSCTAGVVAQSHTAPFSERRRNPTWARGRRRDGRLETLGDRGSVPLSAHVELGEDVMAIAKRSGDDNCCRFCRGTIRAKDVVVRKLRSPGL